MVMGVVVQDVEVLGQCWKLCILYVQGGIDGVGECQQWFFCCIVQVIGEVGVVVGSEKRQVVYGSFWGQGDCYVCQVSCDGFWEKL